MMVVTNLQRMVRLAYILVERVTDGVGGCGEIGGSFLRFYVAALTDWQSDCLERTWEEDGVGVLT